jgi:hypothetical protein
MTRHFRTPFDEARDDQTLLESLEATVRCARGVPFWRDHLPDRAIASLADFEALPLSSRADLSMAGGLGALVSDPREIFRSTYPFDQTVCTFPFQVVAGDMDLYIRHERMLAILAATGHAERGETLILTSPAQYFFASDLCAEIFFEKQHCSMQDVTGMTPRDIGRRIEAFGAEMVILATESRAIRPEIFPASVDAVVTFRGAYPELAELDARVVDVYGLTEAPYLGHRLAGESGYSFDRNHFYLERAPSGALAITTLLWEVMPLIRYRTYDLVGAIDDDGGRVEITTMGEW